MRRGHGVRRGILRGGIVAGMLLTAPAQARAQIDPFVPLPDPPRVSSFDPPKSDRGRRDVFAPLRELAESRRKNAKKRQARKYQSVVRARVITGFAVSHGEPLDLQPGTAQRKVGFYLRQARLGWEGEYDRRLRLRLVLDGAEVQNTASLDSSVVKDAFIEYQPSSFFALRIGRIMRPFSRIGSTPVYDLVTSQYPLAVAHALTPGNDTLGWGRRALGAMVWGQWRQARGYTTWRASFSQPAIEGRGADVHLMLSQRFGRYIDVDLYSALRHARSGDRSNNLFAHGAAGQLNLRGFSALLEFDAFQWPLAVANKDMGPGEGDDTVAQEGAGDAEDNRWGMSLNLQARYLFDIGEELGFGPLAAFEYIDTDLLYQQNESFRAVGGLAFRWSDRWSVWLDGQWVRSRGKAGQDNQFMASNRFDLQVAATL